MRRPSLEEQALLVIDAQDRIFRGLPEDARRPLLDRLVWLCTVARRVDLPVFATELSPRANGRVLPGLPGLHALEHHRVSAARDADLLARLDAAGRRHVVVVGFELHLSVAQTALDLLDHGVAVTLVVDACASRRAEDAQVATRRLEQAGVAPTTTEAQLFDWVDDTASPLFHELHRQLR